MQEVLLYSIMYYVLYAELRGIFTLQGIVILYYRWQLLLAVVIFIGLWLEA